MVNWFSQNVGINLRNCTTSRPTRLHSSADDVSEGRNIIFLEENITLEVSVGLHSLSRIYTWGSRPHITLCKRGEKDVTLAAAGSLFIREALPGERIRSVCNTTGGLHVRECQRNLVMQLNKTEYSQIIF